ncbi:MAG: flagellar basal body P-ring protein FlgI [Phycisphaerae bacterium]
MLPKTAEAAVRVQDIAKLKGQRINRLMGFGLVVGLDGSGDGGKNAPTMRALMALHRRYAQPILDIEELIANDSVALVTVEAQIPEFGAREGQQVDVVVSAIGPAKSIAGGQLLTTPLQESMLSVPNILALAGGRLEVSAGKNQRRAIVRGGATLEEEFIYHFIDGQHITLVLDDQHAGFGWAQMAARAITHALKTPNTNGISEFNEQGELVVIEEIATAIDGRNVRVRIPTYELKQPANFIRLVLESEIFELPRQEARVTINRTTKNVSMSGTVTISPTILQVPGLGSITIGKEIKSDETAPEANKQDENLTRLEDLMQSLSEIQATPDQIVGAIEHLARSGSLHAQVDYVQ